jgi:hypothetical protein
VRDLVGTLEQRPTPAMIAAGNRDPARSPDLDRFDLARDDVDPLSFGGGVHYCLGASPARFGTIELAREPRFMDRLTRPSGCARRSRGATAHRRPDPPGMASFVDLLKIGDVHRIQAYVLQRARQTREAEQRVR